MRRWMGAAMVLFFSFLIASCGDGGGGGGGGGDGGGFRAATPADLENKSFTFPADQDLFDEDDPRFGQDATLTVGTFAGSTAAATITTVNTLIGGTVTIGSCTLVAQFEVVDGELEFASPGDPDAVLVLDPCQINDDERLRVTDDVGDRYTSDPASDPEDVFDLDVVVALSPDNVVDPPFSLEERPESGTGRVTIFSGAQVLNYTLAVDGLSETDTLTNAHIHEGDFGENGAIFITLVGVPVDLRTAGVAFVESNGQLTAGAAFLLTEAEAARLTDPAEPFYLQIHSEEVPSGLLRGQIRGLNRPPVANAGPDQTVAIDALVTLNGSASSDPDGDTLGYAWSFDSTPEGSTAALDDPSAVMPTFTADLEGDYVVQLIVNDGKVNSAPDTVTITASVAPPENTPPVADAGPDQNVQVGALVTLDGTASSDADNDPLTYAWSLTSRPTGSTAALDDATAEMPTFTPDVAGGYVAQLIVNDGTVDSAPDSVTITASEAPPENTPPMADAGPDQNVQVGQLVTLNGSGSDDDDGDPLTFAWSFTSRPAGSTATFSEPDDDTPTFTPDVAGDYVAQLIVNDGTEDSAPDTTRVTATAALDGEQIYLDGGCAVCHAADGSGGIGPNIQGATPQEIRNAPSSITAHIVIEGWSDPEVQAVSDFLSSQ